MKNFQDRKQLANLCRKLASVPTEGGHQADRVLLTLAEELELEIASADNGHLLKAANPSSIRE